MNQLSPTIATSNPRKGACVLILTAVFTLAWWVPVHSADACGIRIYRKCDKGLLGRLALSPKQRSKATKALKKARRDALPWQIERAEVQSKLDVELAKDKPSTFRIESLLKEASEADLRQELIRMRVWLGFRQLLDDKQRATLSHEGCLSSGPISSGANSSSNEEGCDEVTCLVSPEKACCQGR